MNICKESHYLLLQWLSQTIKKSISCEIIFYRRKAMSRQPRNLVLISLMLCFLLLIQSCSAQTERNLTPLVTSHCPSGNVVESEDGIRRLAMIVGVGQYKSPNIPNLPGPPQDAKRFYDMLAGSKGYGFPKENICVLLDAQATTENFKNYFTNVLINQARLQDEVVFYYAGHGSQARDRNGDEPDGMDETFVFHDARSDGIKDFTDDEFDNLLTELHEKTRQITVFLDSCNSGTAMRGDTEFLSRYLPPETEEGKERFVPAAGSDEKSKKAGRITSDLSGVVLFTAAGDGTPALEKNARGIFTDAVLTTLGQVSEKQLTYAQASRQIRPLVKAESYQIPYFQGDLQRSIFSGVNRKQPLSWEIIEVEPRLKLGGFPLPGIGKGAEFRVYDGSIDGADTQDPAKVKAVIVLDESTGLNATANISSRPSNAEPLRPGDLAVLARPSDAQRLMKVTLRPESNPGGISADKAARIMESLEKHIDAKKVIAVVNDKGDFELSLDDDNRYVVSGPENIIRNSFAQEKDVINNLWQFSKQRVFGTLRGEGGNQFVDQETLQVQIVPAKKQDQCAQDIQWRQALPNAVVAQDIPLCYKWNIKVKLSEDAPTRLLVGGLILSTDGSIFGFPQDGTSAPLGPGEEIIFSETFAASKPLNIEDQIIVFGTYETNPVPWARLTQKTEIRSADVKSGLYRALDRYLTGTRGVAQSIETDSTNTAWTLSSMTARVIENDNAIKEP